MEYISSEQYIQAKKAEYFHDWDTYDKIMGCTNSLDCKNTARYTKGLNNKKWEENAKRLCYPGIKAKFEQKIDLRFALLNKTNHKKIVECTSDKLWGNGIPLNRPNCLDQSQWINQILEEVHFEQYNIIWCQLTHHLTSRILSH